ncbi:MAG: GNAT family N-acetyltransferase [Bacteroidota bacterium]|nr:GNAT family N-acetyltransferase [Bacteroidota bacterium]
MAFELQPVHLKNDIVTLVPILPTDFEDLYAVASDPLIWEQHPNPNRYQREVFEKFFEGAILSKGAFMVYDTQTQKLIGTSRFYEYDENANTVAIGYTFIARECWGKNHNRALKTIMLNHAFKYVNSVLFYIGSNNIRSQKAICKLGAVKIDEKPIEYYSETQKLNFVYEIKKHKNT